MNDADRALASRIRDIVAVVTDDVDAVAVAVEDGVAYIEGVVPTERQRRVIVRSVRGLDGLKRVVTCLATERVRPAAGQTRRAASLRSVVPTPVMMHYLS
jgi:hypothetical protein